MKEKYTLYRIYYGEDLVYIGRTKQPLANRIRGHVFARPMHRTIDIELVSRIEYVELPTEADMNIYEIYWIALWHPPLNVDDKPKDMPEIAKLPPLEWRLFETHLWGKWKQEIRAQKDEQEGMQHRLREIRELIPILHAQHREGKITVFELDRKLEELLLEREEIANKLYGRKK